MKAERRHELKENELLHAYSVARDFLGAKGKQISIAVIVVVAVVAVVAFSVRSKGAAREERWRRRGELSFADPEVGKQSLETLAAMTEDVADDQFVFASLLQQGQQALRLAQDAPAPPDYDLNERARQAFERLLERFKDNPLAVGVAHSGLATVEENSFVLDGNPAHKERADAHLAAIIDDPAQNAMPLKRMAMDRRKVLDETFTRVAFEYPVPPEEPEQPSDATAPPSEAADSDSENVEPEDANAATSGPVDTP